MSVKRWLFVLALELITIFIVIALFKSLDKQIAGLVAGFLFGILGLLIGFQLLTTRTLKSFTFLWLFVYMFYSVIPMIIKRMGAWDKEFSEIEIWGMAGPEFHRVSEKIYGILIIATVLDLLLALYLKKKKA